MIKRIGLLMVVALMAAMMMVATAAPAFAASPQQRCEAAGGEFSTEPGVKQCTFTSTESAGNNDRGREFTSETTVEQQGSFSSSHERIPKEGKCENPAGQEGTQSANCPPPESGSEI